VVIRIQLKWCCFPWCKYPKKRKVHHKADLSEI
jgi:hypothetical protein